MAELKVKIIKHFGVLSRGKWVRELNLVRWGERSKLYDLRGWSEDHTVCSKGITLNREELLELKDILNSMEL